VDSIFIAMEYFQYGDLHKFILNSGPCTEFGAKMITMQLLEGLNIMHEMGFTHRDLKPQVLSCS
jgi:serine/threonine protein kinase